MKKRIMALFSMAMLGLNATATVKSGEPAPGFEAKDATGMVHQLSDFKGKYVVLEWYNHGCPFVVKFYQAGEMQALQKRLTGEDVVWLAVNSGAPGNQGHMSAADTIKKAELVGAAATAYIIDEEGTLGKQYGAKTTPHMYLIDPEGILVYQGAIDSIRSAKKEDIAKAENYLIKAYVAHRAGEPVDPSSTQAYGCSVKY